MKKHNGFSLIELMVILAILGAIMTMVVPNLSNLFGQKTLPPVGKLFGKALQITRLEAIQRNREVYLAPVNTDDWSSGWAVQYEDDQDPPVVQTIRVFDAPPSGTSITSGDFNSANPIRIQPSGQAATTGMFELKLSGCIGGNKLQYEVLISGMFNRQVLACP